MSDHDFDLASDLDAEAGLHKLEEQARIANKKDEDDDSIHYTMYGNHCSHPDIVRTHLDSGILVDLITKKEAKMLAMPNTDQEFTLNDPCYVYVFLGALAMTIGCHLPESYLKMLKLVYKEGGLMPDALKQIERALFGSFKNGVPYDFESKNLLETVNSKPDPTPNPRGFTLMNVPSPGGFFNTGMGDSSTSSIIKELRQKRHMPNVCASCHSISRKDTDAAALLVCSGCKDRKYCSTECQKKHWKAHKAVCKHTSV